MAALLAVAAPAVPAWAGYGGTLDPAFGDGGFTLTDIAGGRGPDFAYAVAVQPDGKIVAAGHVQGVPGIAAVGRDVELVRYSRNGTLDAGFGAGGVVVVTDTGPGNVDEARAVAVQPDGKIVVAGSSARASSDFALIRYNGDGTLDGTFGTGGTVLVDVSGIRTNDVAQAMVVQPDGRIVAAGYADNGRSWDFALARFNRDGSLDASFGGDGTVLTDFGGVQQPDQVTGVAVQADGKIVATGRSWEQSNSDFAAARYNRDGSLDASFGGDGTVVTDFSGRRSADDAAAMALQPDGRIVVVGGSYAGGSYDFALVRYRGDGTLDMSFGTEGKVLTDFSGAGRLDFPSAVVVQPNGRIVAVGDSNAAGSFDIALARYRRDGTLDPGFGTGGTVLSDLTGTGRGDFGYAAAVQSRGRLVVAGASDARRTYDFAVARFKL